jgi:hypothetical protein
MHDGNIVKEHFTLASTQEKIKSYDVLTDTSKGESIEKAPNHSTDGCTRSYTSACC